MWGVPIDHEMFSKITSAQWLWYFYNFLKDEDEDFVFDRNMTEYLASFMEPAQVKHLRQLREETEGEKAVQVDDESFMQGIEQMFGRSIDKKDKVAANNPAVDTVINYLKYENIKFDPSRNYRHWSNVKLE